MIKLLAHEEVNLKEILESIVDKIIDSTNLDNLSIHSGEFGKLLFLARTFNHLSIYKKKEITEMADKAILRYVESYPDLPFSFDNGVFGIDFSILKIGHYIHNLRGKMSQFLETRLTFYQAILKNELNKDPDFFSGFGGMLPFLSQYNSIKANALHSNLIHRCLENSVRNEDGLLIWNDSVGLARFNSKLNRNESYYINFGLAHGIPAILFLISRSSKASFFKNQIEEIVQTIRYYELKNKISKFPSFATNSEKSYCQLAWCYGDLSIGFSIAYAGMKIRNKKIHEYGLKVITEALERDKQTSLLNDSCLCHGYSGVLSIIRRIAHYNWRIKRLEWYFKYWLTMTINEFKTNDSLLFSSRVDRQLNSIWEPNYGLFEGAPGVGLVLHDILYEKESDWDSILNLS